jgi:hypothetical protein
MQLFVFFQHLKVEVVDRKKTYRCFFRDQGHKGYLIQADLQGGGLARVV